MFSLQEIRALKLRSMLLSVKVLFNNEKIKLNSDEIKNEIDVVYLISKKINDIYKDTPLRLDPGSAIANIGILVETINRSKTPAFYDFMCKYHQSDPLANKFWNFDFKIDIFKTKQKDKFKYKTINFNVFKDAEKILQTYNLFISAIDDKLKETEEKIKKEKEEQELREKKRKEQSLLLEKQKKELQEKAYAKQKELAELKSKANMSNPEDVQKLFDAIKERRKKDKAQEGA